MTYPNGLTLNYNYDIYGRLSKISSNQPNWPIIADAFLYQPVTNQIYAWRFGNGRSSGVEFDRDNRVAGLFYGPSGELLY
jgi:hypothetical protein